MAKKEITQEQLDQLLEDASYLQGEAEALQYVIEEVPYSESPPEGYSIAEILLLLDHAQLNYYRPILEEAFRNPRPIHIDSFEYFEDTFEVDEGKIKDIQKVLSKLAKHRAGLVNVMKNIPLIDWEIIIYKNDRELLLFDFIQEMIRHDRSRLKEIAEMVLSFNQEKQLRRELKQRQPDHDN